MSPYDRAVGLYDDLLAAQLRADLERREHDHHDRRAQQAMSIFRGDRPDITPAQIGGFLLGGVPVVAKLGQAFGLFELSEDQQQALSDAIQWGVIAAGAFIFGDAGLRASRNARDAKVEAATVNPEKLADGDS